MRQQERVSVLLVYYHPLDLLASEITEFDEFVVFDVRCVILHRLSRVFGDRNVAVRNFHGLIELHPDGGTYAIASAVSRGVADGDSGSGILAVRKDRAVVINVRCPARILSGVPEPPLVMVIAAYVVILFNIFRGIRGSLGISVKILFSLIDAQQEHFVLSVSSAGFSGVRIIAVDDFRSDYLFLFRGTECLRIEVAVQPVSQCAVFPDGIFNAVCLAVVIWQDIKYLLGKKEISPVLVIENDPAYGLALIAAELNGLITAQ